MNPLVKAIEILDGQQNLAALLGISPTAVHKWRKRGMPRTEWTGETNYAEIIEQATCGQVTRTQLLDWNQLTFFKPTTTTIAPG